MQMIMLLFAVIMLIIGVVIIINPSMVFGLIDRYAQSLLLHIIAVVIRLFFGIVFIIAAQSSALPTTIEILGWLFVVAGISLALIGRQNFKNLIAWAMSLVPHYGRVSGIFSIFFASIIGYAALL